MKTTFVIISRVPIRAVQTGHTSYLQQHFAAVDAHGVHGAEGHESDGDRGRRVHGVIVAEHTRRKRWRTWSSADRVV